MKVEELDDNWNNLTLIDKQVTVLDYIAKYFNANNRAVELNSSGEERCKYRTSDGRKCAIGLFIDDELYKRMCEKKLTQCTVMNLLYNGLLPFELRILGSEFLNMLQKLHDTNIYWNDEGLTEFGQRMYKQYREQTLDGAYM